MSTTVRIANEQDAQPLTEVMGAQLSELALRHDASRLAATVREIFKAPDRGFFLVAERDERIIGAAFVSYIWSLEHGGKSAWLEELYVFPQERGQGVGALLLRAVLGEAKNLGCPAIDLEVTEPEGGRRTSEALYLRNGFQALSRRRLAKTL